MKNSEQKGECVTSSGNIANAMLGAVVSEQEQAQWDEAFRQVAEYEKEIEEHNNAILKNLCSSALKNFAALVDGCSVRDKIEIVDAPKGQLQQGEKFGVFKKVYVDQWSVGDSGDSYAGFIYTNHGKSDKWLKIPYEC